MTALLTPREASAQLRCSLSTLNRLVRDGKVPSTRVSARRYSFRQTDIDRYIEKQTRYAGERSRRAA